MIASAKPVDHAQDVLARRSNTFDLDKTIFGSLDGTITRIVQKDRLNVEVFWSDRAAAQIAASFTSIPKAIPHDSAILEFMENDCNFAMEHADGSFMDHLQFCYEYCAAHFREQSPRVLLLHSIMGVGTNYFPMEVSLVPRLQELVTDSEMRHIEAFPSVLRLLLHGPLLKELQQACQTKGCDRLKSVRFHRVIDNKELLMDAETFWVQLNYQLIHLLDFLPVANWSDHEDNTFFVAFKPLFEVLFSAGRLTAHVDFDLTPAERSPDACPPITLGSVIDKLLPSKMKRQMASKAIARFSGKIDHSLDYSIEWDVGSPTSRL